RQKSLAPPTNVRKPRRTQGSYQYYNLHVGRDYRGVQIQYPQPGEYYDHGMILLLRNAYELLDRDDLLSDLFAHFRSRLATAAPAEQVYLHLGLGYLHWWNDERDAAIAEL